MKKDSKHLFDMTHKLVSLKSVSSKDPHLDCSNKACIELLADWLCARGFSITIIPSEGLPHKLNLIASKGTGTDALVFSGHTDTVPFDESKWSSNPFTLTEKYDRWYGLGVCDMKSFFPLIITASERFNLNKLNHPLVITATADEESSMSGMKTLFSKNLPDGAYAIIGEPTNLEPVRMNKGIMMHSLTVQGVPGHSSNPDDGKNAIDGMHSTLAELMLIREELKSKYNNPLFEVPYPTINFGRIFGGDSPNRICPSCTLAYDVRTLPGMDIDAISHEIYERVTKKALSQGFSLTFNPLFSGVGAMETSTDSLLVKTAEKLTGKKAQIVQYCTEGYYYNALGMDTIILGTGSIQQAHKPDEYIEVKNIMPAVDLYSAFIQEFCFNR